MNRLIAALVLVILTATIGCADDPRVVAGGGEKAVLEQQNGRTTGRIDVDGHVVNTGGKRATDVVLFFKFFQAGTLYLEGRIALGTISAGDAQIFSGTFYGSPVDPAAFTWEYRIEWD